MISEESTYFLAALAVVVILAATVFFWATFTDSGRASQALANEKRRRATSKRLFMANLGKTRKARLKERQQRRKSKFIGVVRNDSMHGFKTVLEGPWCEYTTERRSEAERLMTNEASRLGYNAVIKLQFREERHQYRAGAGPKGNPYYRTTTERKWEGQAVLLKARKPQQS